MNRFRFVILALVFVPQLALACRCVSSGNAEADVRNNYASATSVIVARAVDIQSGKSKTSDGQEFESLQVTWAVERAWKGSFRQGDAVVAKTPRHSDECGANVSVGEQHLIFLGRSEPLLFFRCSGGEISTVGKQIPVLDRTQSIPGAGR